MWNKRREKRRRGEKGKEEEEEVEEDEEEEEESEGPQWAQERRRTQDGCGRSVLRRGQSEPENSGHEETEGDARSVKR